MRRRAFLTGLPKGVKKRGVKDSLGVLGVFGVLGVLVGGASTTRPVGTIGGGLGRDRYWVGGQETGPVGTSVADGSADAGFGVMGEELVSVISLIFMIFNGVSVVEALSLSLSWLPNLVQLPSYYIFLIQSCHTVLDTSYIYTERAKLIFTCKCWMWINYKVN